MESFFYTLKAEQVGDTRYPDSTAARDSLFAYVGGFYNTTPQLDTQPPITSSTLNSELNTLFDRIGQVHLNLLISRSTSVPHSPKRKGCAIKINLKRSTTPQRLI